MASTPSTRPRFAGVVESVTQALNAASLAPEPKRLITQSRTTMVTTATPTARAASGAPSATPSGSCGLTRPNAAVVAPQRT